MIGQSFCYSHSNVFKKQSVSRSFYVERSTLSGTREFRKSCFGRKNTMYVLVFSKTFYSNVLKSNHSPSKLTHKRQ